MTTAEMSAQAVSLDNDRREGHTDGYAVRHSAKELTSLIMDEERLRAERANRGSWKSRVTGLEDVPGGTTGYPVEGPPRRQHRQRPGGNEDDDLEYRLAIEASKNQAEEDAARRSGGPPPDTDDDLAKAIKLSREEEELRKRELEDQQQGDLLFDNTPSEQAPQPTGFNQGYQQQAAVDWFGNPLAQQQPQQTGFMNNMYSQPTGQQPFQNQNGYGGGFGYNQPQQTGFDQMQQPQQQFMQPQNTYNPWAQQMNGGYGQQQQQPQQSMQPMQEQPTAQPGSNNPWASSNSSTPVQAQPTGSNNPFATHRPQQQTQSFNKAPTLSTLAEQRATDSFPQQQQQQRPNPIANYSSPATASPMQPQQTAPQQQQKPQDPYQAKLSALLASGEGQDTFGNVGDLRIPAQHTAPGTFVNSAGGGSMGALESSRTGNNPFFTQNTAAQMQYPAQTGPVGSMGGGFGGNNRFGPRPGQGQQQQQSQGGSLIDL